MTPKNSMHKHVLQYVLYHKYDDTTLHPTFQYYSL